jgi:hypothetical protein
MNKSIFLDTTPWNPVKINQRFVEIYRLHLHCRRTSQARNQREAGITASCSAVLLAACFMLVSCLAYSSTLRVEESPKRRLNFT